MNHLQQAKELVTQLSEGRFSLKKTGGQFQIDLKDEYFVYQLDNLADAIVFATDLATGAFEPCYCEHCLENAFHKGKKAIFRISRHNQPRS